MKVIGIAWFLLLGLSACRSTEEKVIERFEDHRHTFYELVALAAQDEALRAGKNKLAVPTRLNSKTQAKLRELELDEVQYVVLSESGCRLQPVGEETTAAYGLESLLAGDWSLTYPVVAPPPGQDNIRNMVLWKAGGWMRSGIYG